ncbi:MAG: gliding motility-associated C-terminal domain-containing protein [Bernardetiaceae bacterium]|nr:gliding motility-associated C-terminal domain-containing protein [Bernardetiaceae bacterium]
MHGQNFISKIGIFLLLFFMAMATQAAPKSPMDLLCLPQDSSALVTLYNSTGGGATWGIAWDFTAPYDTWDGVVTDPDSRCVIALNLAGVGLSGELPGSIFALDSLSELQSLDLSGNDLEGNLPPQIGNSPRLKFLDLSNNQLSGAIPPGIADADSLRHLNLSNNQFNDGIPNALANLNMLRGLFIASNQLTGEVPPDLANLTNLDSLDLSFNNLEGEIPDAIATMTGLRLLYLNDNEFTFFPTFSPIPPAFEVRIENNKLTFNSIENNMSIANFTYAPQDSIETVIIENIFEEQDYSYELILDVGFSNVYNWQKDGAAYSTGNILEINDIVPDDEGTYICVITNPEAPALTLYRRAIILTVLPCPSNNFIETADTTVCEGDPLPVLVGSAADGGALAFSYLWQQSDDLGASWSETVSTKNFALSPTATIANDTTWFRRLLISDCDTNFSDTVRLFIVPEFGENTVGSLENEFCAGQVGDTIRGTFPADTLGSGFTYTWQVSLDNETWVDSTTTLEFVPGVVTDTFYIRRIVLGACVPDTSAVFRVDVIPPLSNADSIFGSQVICAGETPSAIIGSAPEGGTGSYQFYWEEATNLDSADWVIVDSLVNSYTPAEVTDTTYIRRIVKSACFSDTSNIAIIFVEPDLGADSIFTATDRICLGKSVLFIEGLQVQADSGFFYQWEVSLDSINWIITGDSTQNYSPSDSVLFDSLFAGSVPDSFYVRRAVVDSCSPKYSDTLKIFVFKPIDSLSNVISVPDSVLSICAGDTNWSITAGTPRGGRGDYTYRWQVSFDSLNWGNRDDSLHITPFGLNDTTYFRRIVRDSCFSDTSNIVQINVKPNFGDNILNSPGDVICLGEGDVLTITGSPPENEAVSFEYTWEFSQDSLLWFSLDTNLITYASDSFPEGFNYVRRIVRGGCDLDTSNTIKFRILEGVSNNFLTSANQTICEGDSARAITGTFPRGSSDSTYTVFWQTSFDTLSWSRVEGADSLTYFHPGAPTDTIYVRRVVSNGNCIPRFSNFVRIAVIPKISNNIIGEDQLVCQGSVPDTLIGTQPRGGTGTYVYLWQRRLITSDSAIGPWQGVGTDSIYAPPAAEERAEYRRIVRSGDCFRDTSNVIQININRRIANNRIENDDITVCQGEEVPELLGTEIIDTLNNIGFFRYQWQISSNRRNWQDIDFTDVPTYRPEPLDTTTYFRRLVINDCFTDSSNIVMITVNRNPNVFAGLDTTINIGFSVQLRATGAISYRWEPSETLDNDSIPNPVATPTFTTEYIVTGTNAQGCSSRDTVVVTVIGRPDVRAVDAITPDGNGLNEFFHIEGIERYPNTEVLVFNRWGQQVYRSNNYQNDWGGTAPNGQLLPEGTYFYILRFESTSQVIKGSLEILR